MAQGQDGGEGLQLAEQVCRAAMFADVGPSQGVGIPIDNTARQAVASAMNQFGEHPGKPKQQSQRQDDVNRLVPE